MIRSYVQIKQQPSLEDLYKTADILSVKINLLLKQNIK